MMKILLFTIFLCIANLYTVRHEMMKITHSTSYSINHIVYSKFIAAIIKVESSGDSMAINSTTDAAGILQIRPIMVNEVNRLVGYIKFTLADRWNIGKSIEMFLIYQKHYNPDQEWEKMARCWNGGPRGSHKEGTIGYWTKVNRYFLLSLGELSPMIGTPITLNNSTLCLLCMNSDINCPVTISMINQK